MGALFTPLGSFLVALRSALRSSFYLLFSLLTMRRGSKMHPQESKLKRVRFLWKAHFLFGLAVLCTGIYQNGGRYEIDCYFSATDVLFLISSTALFVSSAFEENM